MRLLFIWIMAGIAALMTGFAVYAAPEDAEQAQAQHLDQRLNEATQLLNAQQTDAEYWEYGWGTFDTGTMIWSTVSAARDDNRRDRSMDIVNAAESLIGLGDVVFRPLPAFNADRICQQSLTAREEADCVATTEALLESSARRAGEPYEWWPHLGNFGFNMAAGLIVWGLADSRRALLTAIPGEIIGEAQIWTTPTGPIADWEGYRVKFGPFLSSSSKEGIPATGIKVGLEF